MPPHTHVVLGTTEQHVHPLDESGEVGRGEGGCLFKLCNHVGAWGSSDTGLVVPVKDWDIVLRCVFRQDGVGGNHGFLNHHIPHHLLFPHILQHPFLGRQEPRRGIDERHRASRLPCAEESGGGGVDGSHLVGDEFPLLMLAIERLRNFVVCHLRNARKIVQTDATARDFPVRGDDDFHDKHWPLLTRNERAALD